MRIDYCPKCNKAGLKVDRIPIPYWKELTPEETAAKREAIDNNGRGNKWCPRCMEWVKPINRPYVGTKGNR